MEALNSIQSVSRRSLHDEVVERLRDFVVEGNLKAGQKIPEKELCERLGISRTPLREALKVLAADRLITLIPNRGAVARELTHEDIEEVFPVMGTLEALAGELACQQITDQELADIKVVHERMLRLFKDDNLTEYFHCNQEIHQRILAAARNRTLASHYQSLATQLRRARFLANITTGRWSEAVTEHEAMLVALQRRDGEALGRIMKAHLQHTFAAVLNWLESQKEPAQ